MPVAATTIDRLAQELEQRKIANQRPILILGSRAGGLFRSPYFYETMEGYSTRSFVGISTREQFGACYNTLSSGLLQKNDIYVIIQGSLDELSSTIADTCIATLIQQDLFQYVLSNNVGELLENALIAQGMAEQQHFFVYYPGRLIGDILFPMKPSACRLIKLCGDEQQFAHNISKRRFQEEGSQYMNELLQRLRTKAQEALIVGVDLDWDAGIIAALPAQLKTVWLINEDEAVKDFVGDHYPQIEQIKHIIGADGEYQKFCLGLSWHINPVIPKNYEDSLHLVNQLHNLHEDLRSMRRELTSIREEITEIKKNLSKGEE